MTRVTFEKYPDTYIEEGKIFVNKKHIANINSKKGIIEILVYESIAVQKRIHYIAEIQNVKKIKKYEKTTGNSDVITKSAVTKS